jgi:hypothetical protein
MDERVIEWSRGRRVRIVVMDVPADFDRLVRRVADDARLTNDRTVLADDVSHVFGKHVRMRSIPIHEGEEIVIEVG